MNPHEIRQTGLSLFTGAGASSDLGFPSGEQLKWDLVATLDQPWTSDLGFTEATIREFTTGLRSSSAQSVDAFLRENRGFLELGRLSVWITILSYERRVTLAGLRKSWFYSLLTKLFADCKRLHDLDRRGGNNSIHFLHGLRIQTLNYDRVAEHVVWTWLADQFPNEDLNRHGYISTNIEESAVIRHLHGSLGRTRGEDALPFGALPPKDPRKIVESAKKLRFWFEPTNKSYAYPITNQQIENAGIHLILGFGYHDDVSKRFEPPKRADCVLRKVIATCRDQSPEGATIKRARAWLEGCYGDRNLEMISHRDGCSEAVEALFAAD